jgi:alanine racemase
MPTSGVILLKRSPCAAYSCTSITLCACVLKLQQSHTSHMATDTHIPRLGLHNVRMVQVLADVALIHRCREELGVVDHLDSHMLAAHEMSTPHTESHTHTQCPGLVQATQWHMHPHQAWRGT